MASISTIRQAASILKQTVEKTEDVPNSNYQ